MYGVEVTEPLKNGAELPNHPSNTTSRKVVKYSTVRDAEDNQVLTGGLHQNELRMLAQGSQMSLTHLYRYGMMSGKIYHTRPAVIVEVECVDVQ